MSTFILDGKRADELGLVMLRQSQRPVLPGTVDRILQIPGRHGAWDFGADLQPRLFDLECAFITNSQYELQKKISGLAAFLVDPYGRPRNLSLTFTVQPDRSYTVRYSGSMPIERLAGSGRFTLPLVAYDPFAYAAANAYDKLGQYDAGYQYDSGLMYENPDQFDWKYKEHMSGVHNYSNLVTPIKLTITGNVKNPKITNVSSGKSMRFAVDLSGQSLVVDGNNMTVTVDGTNMLHVMEGDFLNIVPGDNGFVFSSDINPVATVIYNWQHKFL